MHWLGYGWIALSVWVLVAGEADAASCFAGLDVVLPSGSVDAPPNTKIWIGNGYATEDVRLLDASGNEVPTTSTSVTRTDGDGELYVLTPDAPLAAADYTVVTGPEDTVVTSFTVGGEVDTTSPQRPGGITEASPSPTCTLIETDAAERTEEVVIARVEGGGSLDVDAPSGDVHDIGMRGVFVIGDCGCETTWTDGAPGREFTVDFAAFDVAGNFSGWSEPDSAMLAEQEEAGCGCSSSSTVAPSLLLWLLATGFRRRTRRQTTHALGSSR